MDVDDEQEVLLLTYPFGTQHDDNGENPKQSENVNAINLGVDDQWWVDNEYVIQNLESHTLSKKNKESDGNVNDKELGDKDDGYLEDGYESNDSVRDVEALTDDEEYISNKVRAEETKRKKAMINVVTVDDDKENEEDGNARADIEVEDDVNAATNGAHNEVINPGNGINEGIDEGNAGNEGDAYFFDLGGGFKQWKCPDDDQLISDSDIDPRSSSDEDDWIKHPRQKRVREVKFNPKIDIKEFDFCVEMIFENLEQLKDQIRAYAACHGYAIWFSKNDKQRIQAKCTGCPWSLWASYEGNDATFKIKSYQKNHVCPAKTSLRAVNSKWLAKVLGDKIRENPFMKLINVKNMVKRDVGREVNLKLCFRTKERALNEVRHSLKDHYSKLWNYVYELGRSNPGSTIVLKGTGDEWCGPPVFRRFYMCFDAVKRGFVNGCRKFVGVDGCFLKTWIKSELLVAMGKDANNQMFPIAWAVVEKEDQHTWGWFLNLLGRDIKMEKGTGWTIMSDQQKGLEHAVKDLFPDIYHRNCARHIYANFRKRGFTGVNFRRYFWAAAKSTTLDGFEKNMEKIKAVSQQGYKHLMDREPARWCKAFFPVDCTCDSVDNNICESFNFWIIEARYYPLISMLEAIRLQVMARMRDRREYMRKRLADGFRFGHRVLAILGDSITNSRECTAIWNGDSQFEIGGSRGGTIVDLNAWTCTCRVWQLTGIPCCHAVSAIALMREGPESYIYGCLSGDTYLKCYEHMLKPLNGMHLWPHTDKPVLLPPAPRILKGRPKWMRRRDALEDGKGKPTNEIPQLDEEDPYKVVKKSKKGMKMTCRHCRKEGHNIRKCPDRPVQNDVPEGQSGEAARGTQIPTQRREKHPVRRNKDFGCESATLGERNNVVDGSTSAARGCGRQGQVPKNVASGVNIRASASVLQPSFTKRTTSFITPEHLLQQSRVKKKISRGSF